MDGPKRGPQSPPLHELVRRRLDAGTLFKESPADESVSPEPFGDAVLRRTGEILNPRHRHDAARARREARMAEVAETAGSERPSASTAEGWRPSSLLEAKAAFAAALNKLPAGAQAARERWQANPSDVAAKDAYLAALPAEAQVARRAMLAFAAREESEAAYEVVDYPEDDSWNVDEDPDEVTDIVSTSDYYDAA